MPRPRRFLLSNQTRTFAPTSLSGLALWLDSSDASSVTLDGSNNVSQWADKSGNARHAAQADTNLRPTYLANGINGLPALRGDGVDDMMSWPIFTSGTNHNFYIVAAFDNTINLMPQYSGFLHGPIVATWEVRMADTSANPAVGVIIPYAASQEIQPAGSAYNIKSGIPAVYSFKRNAGVYKAKWTHGSEVSQGPIAGSHTTQATTTTTLFRGQGGSFSASFRISEVVCYARDLTAGEESQLSNYFASRYGVGI